MYSKLVTFQITQANHEDVVQLNLFFNLDSTQMNQSVDLLLLTYASNTSGEITQYMNKPESISAASTRLQMVPLINAAANLGLSTAVWSFHSQEPEVLNEVINLKSIKALIIGKMSADTKAGINSMIMANSAAILFLKSKKIPLILLYSDNHLIRDDSIGEFYRTIMSYTNAVITPSQALKDEVDRYTKSKINSYAINDPWQVPQLSFKKSKNIDKNTNILWFGQGRNIEYLCNEIPKILRDCEGSSHFCLKVLARKNAITVLKQNLPAKIPSKRKWTIEYIEWDDLTQPKQFLDSLKFADISIIPSNAKDPKKLGVSHNRLVDSIRSGCISIASPLKSYIELSEASLIGEDFPAMIDFAIANYDYLCDQFESKRDNLLLEFSPQANSLRWEQLISSLIS